MSILTWPCPLGQTSIISSMCSMCIEVYCTVQNISNRRFADSRNNTTPTLASIWPYNLRVEVSGFWAEEIACLLKKKQTHKDKKLLQKNSGNWSSSPGQGTEDKAQGGEGTKSEVYKPGCGDHYHFNGIIIVQTNMTRGNGPKFRIITASTHYERRREEERAKPKEK